MCVWCGVVWGVVCVACACVRAHLNNRMSVYRSGSCSLGSLSDKHRVSGALHGVHPPSNRQGAPPGALVNPPWRGTRLGLFRRALPGVLPAVEDQHRPTSRMSALDVKECGGYLCCHAAIRREQRRVYRDTLAAVHSETHSRIVV